VPGADEHAHPVAVELARADELSDRDDASVERIVVVHQIVTGSLIGGGEQM